MAKSWREIHSLKLFNDLIIIKVAMDNYPENFSDQRPITTTQPNFKLLIIEDDKFLRDLIGQKLLREGFKVYSASGGEEGLKLAMENRPDLILLDLVLPGMDGFEVLEKAKKDPKLSSIPILILSNLGQKEDVDRAIALGASDFMVKANYTPGEITEKIKTILKQSYL